jgi:hypothetical protein
MIKRECVIYCFVACIFTYTLTKKHHMKELLDLQKKLNKSQFLLNNYRESGAVYKRKVEVITYPGETSGLKSLCRTIEWIEPDELKKRNDIVFIYPMPDE